MPTVTERNVLLYSLVFAAWAVALVPRRHLFSFGKKKKRGGLLLLFPVDYRFLYRVSTPKSTFDNWLAIQSSHLLAPPTFIHMWYLAGRSCVSLSCLVAPYKYKHTNIHTYTYVDWKNKTWKVVQLCHFDWRVKKKLGKEIHTFFLSSFFCLPSPSRLLLSVGDLTRLAPLKNGFPRIFSFLFSLPCYNIFTPNFILGNLINHVVAGTPESAWLETKLSAIFALIIWF